MRNSFMLSIFLLLAAPTVGLTAAVTVVDGRGKPVALVKPFQRVVSLSLASDEIVMELLRDDLSRLVGVSKFVTDGRYSGAAELAATRKIKVLGDNLETILALKPDIAILATFNRPDIARKLDASGVKTFVLSSFNSIDDVKSNIALLGELLGKQAAATKLINNSFSSLAQIETPKKQVSVLSFSENLVIPGRNTLFDSVCKAAKVANITSEKNLTGWAKVNEEALITFDPDFVIVPFTGSQTEKHASQAVINHPTYGKLSAVKKRRFIYVPTAQLMSVSHHVADAVRAIHQGAYEN